jgi:hypothetical protein
MFCTFTVIVRYEFLQAFNTPLEVYNFPLIERQRSEIEHLEVVKARRRIEMAELAVNERFLQCVKNGRDTELSLYVDICARDAFI